MIHPYLSSLNFHPFPEHAGLLHLENVEQIPSHFWAQSVISSGCVSCLTYAISKLIFFQISAHISPTLKSLSWLLQSTHIWYFLPWTHSLLITSVPDSQLIISHVYSLSLKIGCEQRNVPCLMLMSHRLPECRTHNDTDMFVYWFA